MKKHWIISLLVLTTTVLSLSAEEYFFKEYNSEVNENLSKAYKAVGDQFLLLGQKGKSEYYINLSELMVGVENSGEAMDLISPEERKAILYYFNKLTSSFFSENTTMILSCIANRIYLPFIEDGLTQDEMEAELAAVFEDKDLINLFPGEIYQMETLNITALSQGYYRLDIEINEEYLPLLMELTFWNKFQSYYFKKLENGWRVNAIGGTGG